MVAKQKPRLIGLIGKLPCDNWIQSSYQHIRTYRYVVKHILDTSSCPNLSWSHGRPFFKALPRPNGISQKSTKECSRKSSQLAKMLLATLQSQPPLKHFQKHTVKQLVLSINRRSISYLWSTVPFFFGMWFLDSHNDFIIFKTKGIWQYYTPQKWPKELQWTIVHHFSMPKWLATRGVWKFCNHIFLMIIRFFCRKESSTVLAKTHGDLSCKLQIARQWM